VPGCVQSAQLAQGVVHDPGLAQTLAEQTWGLTQFPQLNIPPQLSGMLPQFFPCAAQVVGVQVAHSPVDVLHAPEHGVSTVPQAQAPAVHVPGAVKVRLVVLFTQVGGGGA
jgi:hypothetical protein